MRTWHPWNRSSLPALALLAVACGGGNGNGDAGEQADSGLTTVGTGETGEGSADGSEGSGAGDGSGDGEADDGPKFDLGDGDPPEGCEGGAGGNTSFSYIWIANSAEGTVSKINTETGVEEGRYRTSMAGTDSPSRTSVNQFGEVAVGNRIGGGAVTKIAATIDRCVEKNGVPGIQTSTGPADIHAYLADECAVWSTPLPIGPDGAGPRGIAWEGGSIDPVTCQNTVPNPRLWVAYGGNPTEVYRLDGATGAILDHFSIPTGAGLIYGGAVNAEGDLWIVNRGVNLLHHIDAVTLAVTTHQIPAAPYGMGVDQNGDPWVVVYQAGPGVDHVYRFDVVSGTFVDAGGTHGYYRGMNLDRSGRVWVGGNSPCRLAAFDATTDTLISDDIPLPGCGTPVGVSIDFNGKVWVVDNNGTAFKVNPDTYAIELTVGGLVGPYTYSDMTGSGLNLVVNPPG